MRFADIPEHEPIKRRLQYIAQHNQIPHAQLFWGPPGSAQMSLALAFATYLHCTQQVADDACGQCASCLKMEKLVHPDVKFVFPIGPTKKLTGKEVASNNYLSTWRSFVQTQPYGLLSDWSYQVGSEQKHLAISKEESKQITQYISMKPLEGIYKIILIWLPEYLHPTAANALLKILEEPGPQTIFLLISMAPEKVLNTIRSRTQQIHVPAFSDQAITQLLANQYPLKPEELNQIVSLADGNLNQAFKLVGNSNQEVFEQFTAWMRLCYTQHLTKLIAQAEVFQQLDKEAQKYFLAYALHMFREALIIHLGQSQLSKATALEQEFLAKFRKNLTDQQINHFTGWINQAYYYLERNVNTKLLLLNLSLKITQAFREPLLEQQHE
jgi:DNA polymerase-3 subunit delta'